MEEMNAFIKIKKKNENLAFEVVAMPLRLVMELLLCIVVEFRVASVAR